MPITILKHIEAGPVRFISVEHRIPKAGTEVVGYNRSWVNETNQRGTRTCFIHPESRQWISAYWDGEKFETEYGSRPTQWKSTGQLPDEDLDGNVIPNPNWNDPEQDSKTTYEDIKYLLPAMDDLPSDVIQELKWLSAVYLGDPDVLFSWDNEDNEDCPALAKWAFEQFGLTRFFIDMRLFLPENEEDH